MDFYIKGLWIVLLLGHFQASLKGWLWCFENLSNILSKNLWNNGYKMQNKMCSFLFFPANNHDIFCVTQSQLYREGNWQFRYYYDIWKSLNVFWKILCDKVSQIKIWDVLFSMLSCIRYFLPYLTVSVRKMSYTNVNFGIFIIWCCSKISQYV